ncbi:hypothetical protein C455_07120 [Haloferax larsenii JCM 13917]|nr:hypothetical protein C455_07120 [Haloferax larsenii JCM 13917]
MQGDNDNPIDQSPKGLLPAPSFFGDDWTQNPDGGNGMHPMELDGETATTGFHSGDGGQAVNTHVTVFDSVENATTAYQDMREYDSDGAGAENLDIASESYSTEIGSIVTVYFRDANCIGMLNHVSDEVPTKPVEYSADWHKTWRDG